MKVTKANQSPKSKNDFTPVAVSMAFLAGMFAAIQAYFFRNTP